MESHLRSKVDGADVFDITKAPSFLAALRALSLSLPAFKCLPLKQAWTCARHVCELGLIEATRLRVDEGAAPDGGAKRRRVNGGD